MPIATGTALLAAGGIQAGSSLLSSAFNIAEAAKNRRFQERMSSTAHQREMADLSKAGLNPLLTAKYGGSSTPGGNVATIENPLKDALSTALQYQQLKLQNRNVSADINLKNANAAKVISEKNAIDQTYRNVEQRFPIEMEKIKSEIKNVQVGSAVGEKTKLKLQAEINKLVAEYNKIKVQSLFWEKIKEGAENLSPHEKKFWQKFKDLRKKINKYLPNAPVGYDILQN